MAPDPFAWDDDETVAEYAGDRRLTEHLVTYNAAAAIVAALEVAGWRKAVTAELKLLAGVSFAEANIANATLPSVAAAAAVGALADAREAGR